jgi:threonine dehydrogenase-like Zn-dependent dehydrogenase
VPDDVDDESAVLSDPASVVLHAISQAPPDDSSPVLVYGCGTLGLIAIALVRTLYPGREIWAVSLPGRSADLAWKLGADQVFDADPDAVVDSVAAHLGVRRLMPWSGRAWLQDGPAIVYDMVGSPQTIETAMRLVDTHGRIVITGVEPPGRFEWTPWYFKELRVIGSNAFGIEEVAGVRKHAYEHYFDLVRAGLDLHPLVTHRFPLIGWRDAILTVARRRRTQSVKVLLEP